MELLLIKDQAHLLNLAVEHPVKAFPEVDVFDSDDAFSAPGPPIRLRIDEVGVNNLSQESTIFSALRIQISIVIAGPGILCPAFVMKIDEKAGTCRSGFRPGSPSQ